MRGGPHVCDQWRVPLSQNQKEDVGLEHEVRSQVRRDRCVFLRAASTKQLELRKASKYLDVRGKNLERRHLSGSYQIEVEVSGSY